MPNTILRYFMSVLIFSLAFFMSRFPGFFDMISAAFGSQHGNCFDHKTLYFYIVYLVLLAVLSFFVGKYYFSKKYLISIILFVVLIFIYLVNVVGNSVLTFGPVEYVFPCSSVINPGIETL